MKAIILAAGMGKRLRNFTNKPKCLIEVGGRSLVSRCILFLIEYGVKEIVIVTGYKKKYICNEIRRLKPPATVKIIYNPDFSKGSILSLWKASLELKQDTLIIDGDVYFEKGVFEKIFSSKKKDFFLLDSTVKGDKEAVMVGFRGQKAQALERGLKDRYDLCGEWAGFLKLSRATSMKLKKILAHKVFCKEEKIGYEFVIPELFKTCSISYELIDGLKWAEIDFLKDIKYAKSLAKTDRLRGEQYE